MFRYYPKMISVLFILLIDGVCLGIYSSQITHMIPYENDLSVRNKKAGFCTILLGVGATIGGFLSGYLSDKMKIINAGKISIFFFIMGCIVNYITVQIQSFPLTLFAAFTWGFQLFYLEGWMYVVCSKTFKG
jgi:sugar phosphate permease